MNPRPDAARFARAPRIVCAFLLFVVTSCDHVKEKPAPKIETPGQTEDSLLLKRSLADALSIAHRHKNQGRFADSTGAMTPDSEYSVDITLKQDFYFSRETPHLIIWRKAPDRIYIDIFT